MTDLVPVTSRAAWLGKPIYEILIERLYRLEDMLVGRGFKGPIQRIRFHIEILDHLRNTPRIDTDETLWSLVEATELADIYCTLPHLPNNLFRRKFTDILAGPFSPQHETKASNLSRNTAFELNLAGWLSYKGIPTQMHDSNPDISCSVADRRVFIQCKRPFTRKRAVINLKRACKQLSEDLDAAVDPRHRGVVALSLSHALNPDQMHIRVRTEAHLNLAITRQIRDFADQILLPLINGPRIVGLVCHAAMPVLVTDIHQYRTGQVMALYPSRAASQADRALLRSVFLPRS